MADSETQLRQIQMGFASHIRDPERHTRPADVEDRRMAVYRELFYNNVEGFLKDMFPVLRSLYDDDAWHAMARDFFANHRCSSPLFLEIAQEFLDYLGNERGLRREDPPFLLELAHYEWVELALSVSDQEPDLRSVDPAGDLLADIPVLSPLAWSLVYQYPVHRIGVDYRPDAPGNDPTHLVVYRGLDDEVGFLQINPVTARLMELLAVDGHSTGRSLLTRIAEELGHPAPETVVSAGSDILEQLRDRHVILGTRTD